MQYDLSIITPTRKRWDQLSNQIQSVRRQVVGTLRVEHIVVVDGADDEVSVWTARALGCTPILSTRPCGFFGAGAKATGIEAASGLYVACWDDDDCYEPHAAVATWASAHGVDIGLCQMRHMRPMDNFEQIIPAEPPTFGRFSGTSMCVRRELALAHSIFDGNCARGTDWRWYQRLLAAGATARYLPIQIGTLVDTYYPAQESQA